MYSQNLTTQKLPTVGFGTDTGSRRPDQVLQTHRYLTLID
jgi:hypothetical protein